MKLGHYLNMNNISAVIVVKGNPEHIFETLDSIRSLVNEIIIGDIGIDGELLDTLRRTEHVKIVSFEKKVPYVELIREQLHKQARGEYILVLDPDEIVPPSLASLLETAVGKCDYVKIPRKNIIFGKWIEHSRWWPDYQIRFFKKGVVVWSTAIHSQPQVSGLELVIEPKVENALVHYNYKDLDEYLSKAPRYAKAEASEILKQVQDENAHEGDTGFARFSKKALSEFIGRYFADEGYKDGMHGFVLSFLQVMYYFLVYFYVWELGGAKEVNQKTLMKDTVQFFSDSLYEIGFWCKKKGMSNISFVKSKLHSLARKIS